MQRQLMEGANPSITVSDEVLRRIRSLRAYEAAKQDTQSTN
jgi:hypothetical protein